MNWKASKLVKDTSVMTFGMGLRTIAQGTVFIVIARNMGTNGYGGFVSVVALATILANIIGFGTHVLLTRDTALDSQKFNKAWGLTLASISISIPLIFIFYLLIAVLFLPNTIDNSIILIIGVAELVFWPLSNVCISAYQGFARIGRATRIILIPVLTRFFAAMLFLLIFKNIKTENWLLIWALLYLFASIIAMIYSQIIVYRDLGLPIMPKTKNLVCRIKESIPFSIWGMSDKLYIDADKIMLARLTSLDVTGIYSAAYRIIDIFILPIHGLIGAATHCFFQAGNKGIRYSLSYSVKLIKLPILYALSISLLIYLCADFILYLLGNGFHESVNVIRFLALLPIIILPKIIMQSILASAGFQIRGMWIIFTGAIINIFCNILLIPVFGWSGAAIATYIAEISMGLVMIITISNILKNKSDTKLALETL